MSTSLIAIAVVVGIGLTMGLVYISHTIERQKAKRALMIANLSEKAQRLQTLIDKTPPAFLPNELKAVILREINGRYQKLVEAAPGNGKFKRNFDATTAQLAELQNSTTKHPVPQMKTQQEADQVKVRLQELNKAVEAFVKTERLSPTEGQAILTKIQNTFVEANVKYYINQGERAKQENKPKVAILNFQKAVEEFSKRNKNQQFAEQIAQLKAAIAELSQLDENSDSKPSQSGTELTKGLDDLIEDDNSWKKKYF